MPGMRMGILTILLIKAEVFSTYTGQCVKVNTEDLGEPELVNLSYIFINTFLPFSNSQDE